MLYYSHALNLIALTSAATAVSIVFFGVVITIVLLNRK